jgi:hypothetical protein
MSREEDAKNTRLFDVRAVERNIRKGLITRKDYEKHLKTLPDVTDKIAPKDAPFTAPASRPAEYVPPPIVVTPAPPSAAGADEGDDLDDELDDDDLEDLDDEDDDDDDEPNGAHGGEEPPSS